MSPAISDAEHLDALLPRLRSLESDAFTALYDAMARQLLTFANGLLGDRESAEDIVQDTFVRFARHARRFRGDGRALLAWLYTTARRRCIDHRRRHSTHREVPVARLPDVEASPPVPLQVDPGLESAMASLTDPQRTAIVLRRILGYSGEEVGALMGLDREAIYALCARGERALRTRLASDAAAPDRPER
jgi:RNA polymerase sigma-70 factor (ECF subfamily)